MDEQNWQDAIKTKRGNEWFRLGHLEVYLRWGTRRLFDDRPVETIEIGSVIVTPTKQDEGVFTRFLEELELIAALLDKHVFIENTITSSFEEFFHKRGYTQVSGPPLPCLIYRPLIVKPQGEPPEDQTDAL